MDTLHDAIIQASRTNLGVLLSAFRQKKGDAVQPVRTCNLLSSLDQ